MHGPVGGGTTIRRELAAESAIVIASIVGFAAFLLYWRTLFPSVLAGDSAEFQVLATQLGLSHAPGHVVYISLAHLFSRLGVGPPAHLVNLFSGVMGAATVGQVYLAAHVLTRNRFASLTGALGRRVPHRVTRARNLGPCSSTASQGGKHEAEAQLVAEASSRPKRLLIRRLRDRLLATPSLSAT